MNNTDKQLLKESLDKLSHVKGSAAEAYVNAQTSLDTIAKDPYMNPTEKGELADIVGKAQQRTGGSMKGLLSNTDLARGAAGAGLGYGASSIAGSVLGGLFNLPGGIQKKLSGAGALYGALRGSGIIGNSRART